MNGMSGDIVVAGLVTGTHIIEDINISVPHQVAVRIPAEMALRSKDLWRAIQQQKVFKLDAGHGLQIAVKPTPASTPDVDSDRVSQLETENKRLTQELALERQRNERLQDLLSGLQAQLQEVKQSLGRLEDGPKVVQVVQASQQASPGAVTGVVGGEVPTFVPEKIRPEAAEAQIRSSTETVEKTNVSSAVSKLRELKKQSSTG